MTGKIKINKLQKKIKKLKNLVNRMRKNMEAFCEFCHCFNGEKCPDSDCMTKKLIKEVKKELSKKEEKLNA